MKATQRTYLLKTIRKNIVSFFAVALMVATGVSIYLGDQSAALAILSRADQYFKENQLHSLEVSSVYGITEDDLELISGWDGVDAVEGGYSSMMLLHSDNGMGNILIQAHAMLETMNLPVLLDGELPSADNHAAIEEMMAEKEGISVGDTIKLSHNGELKAEEFLVTAIINEPAFCSSRAKDARGMSDIGIGSAYYYISLPKAAFDASYYNDCYTTAYIRNDELDRYFYFSDEYKEQEALFRDHVEVLGNERAQVRFEEVKLQIQDELADAEKELKRQTKNLSDAKAMLSYVFEQIGLPTDFKEAKIQLDSYEKLREPLLKVIEEYENGEQKLADAEERFHQAQADFAKMEPQNWVISIRNDIGDVRSIEAIVEGLYGLSYSMAIIFVIVSVTVCHSAISRMISEHRTQIGMQKALGFTTKEIMRHFMSYSVICGIVGVLQGWFAAFLTVQMLNLSIYKTVFLLGDIPLAFSWPHAILVSVFFMAIFIAASYTACVKEISRPATELLRGETPEREKPFVFENWGIYKKLRLYTRTMIKNAFSDRSRMMTTVMGVAGCATLLVICFTLLIAMDKSSVIQFEDYFLYDHRLVIDSDKGDAETFERILDETEIPYTKIQDKLKLFRGENGDWSGVHVVAVSDAQELKDFMVLENPDTRELLEIPENGVLISIKCADNLDLWDGGFVELMDSAGNIRKAEVSGVIEHYLNYNLFVMSTEYYEAFMSEPADECVFLLNGPIDGLYEKVKAQEGFISLRDNSEFTGLGDVMNMVVIVCFVFAAIMAVLVMLNQNVMYINRKAKELSVMRINGFTLKETKAFVSRDNFVLTSMGILVGWGFGITLGYLVIRVLEVSVTHYVRTPSIQACMIAAAICGIFAYLMNKAAVQKVHRLNLTDVNAN